EQDVTSIQPEMEFNAKGYFRNRYLRGVEASEGMRKVFAMDGVKAHRLHPGRAEQRYWVVEAGQAGGFAELFARLSAGEVVSAQPIELGHRPLAVRRHSESVLWCSYAQLCEVPLSALDFIGLCDRYRAILMDDLPCLSASQREGRIARGTEDGAQLVEAGDRELPQLSVHDDGVRRFIALVDECYDRKVPLYLEARVPLEALYTEGYLAFAFRRTLSRLREMQLARFGSDSAG
ncbi:cell division protein ZapE, partial [Pseudomonas aeruginosa]|uniref:cell division protein ZapE n=1 Tax=Pseudomonas aeruginosa TaxID=287 RepID=UPI003D2D158D